LKSLKGNTGQERANDAMTTVVSGSDRPNNKSGVFGPKKHLRNYIKDVKLMVRGVSAPQNVVQEAKLGAGDAAAGDKCVSRHLTSRLQSDLANSSELDQCSQPTPRPSTESKWSLVRKRRSNLAAASNNISDSASNLSSRRSMLSNASAQSTDELIEFLHQNADPLHECGTRATSIKSNRYNYTNHDYLSELSKKTANVSSESKKKMPSIPVPGGLKFRGGNRTSKTASGYNNACPFDFEDNGSSNSDNDSVDNGPHPQLHQLSTASPGNKLKRTWGRRTSLPEYGNIKHSGLNSKIRSKSISHIQTGRRNGTRARDGAVKFVQQQSQKQLLRGGSTVATTDQSEMTNSILTPIDESDMESYEDKNKRKLEKAARSLYLACWNNAPMNEIEQLLQENPTLLNPGKCGIDIEKTYGQTPIDIVKSKARLCMCGCCNYNRRRVLNMLQNGGPKRYLSRQNSVELSSIESPESEDLCSRIVDGMLSGNSEMYDSKKSSGHAHLSGTSRSTFSHGTLSSKSSLNHLSSSNYTSGASLTQSGQSAVGQIRSPLFASTETSGYNSSVSSSLPTEICGEQEVINVDYLALTEETISRRDKLELQLLHDKEQLWMKYTPDMEILDEIILELHRERDESELELRNVTSDVAKMNAVLNLSRQSKDLRRRAWRYNWGREEDGFEFQIGLAYTLKSDIERQILDLSEQIQRALDQRARFYYKKFGDVDKRLEELLGKSVMRSCSQWHYIRKSQ